MALLIPREHGAYGQLLMPLLVSLVIGGAAAGALALAAAAVAAFLAHEPLLVLLGQRDGRASRDRNADARRSFSLASWPLFRAASKSRSCRCAAALRSLFRSLSRSWRRCW